MATATSPLDLLPGPRRTLLQRIKLEGGLSAGDAALFLDITVAGVRPHLSGLVRAGLLACTRVSEGPGRPRHLYTLTPAGDALFPRRYGEMARELLEYVEELSPELLPDVFARRARRRLRDAQGRIGTGPLGARVRELARILDEDGYLAEVKPAPGGGFLLVEHNCPVLTVAQRHAHACSSEIDFLREALPDARVRRVSHILRGAPACAYEIVPRDDPSTPFWRCSMAYPFSLPDLGFGFDALEPHIDARTMEIHHGKHHAGYTKNLNSALEGHGAFHGYSGEQLLRGLHSVPQEIRTAVRNNGGGFVNHALFWEILAPGGSTSPQGDLAAAIDQTFGSFDDLKAKVNDAAAKQFGSGWGWLAVSPFGELQVLSTANQDSPLIDGSTPILGVDVWEHAYYLNYQNRRPDYLSAIWNVINWDVVGEKYAEARGGWIRTV